MHMNSPWLRIRLLSSLCQTVKHPLIAFSAGAILSGVTVWLLCTWNMRPEFHPGAFPRNPDEARQEFFRWAASNDIQAIKLSIDEQSHRVTVHQFGPMTWIAEAENRVLGNRTAFLISRHGIEPVRSSNIPSLLNEKYASAFESEHHDMIKKGIELLDPYLKIIASTSDIADYENVQGPPTECAPLDEDVEELIQEMWHRDHEDGEYRIYVCFGHRGLGGAVVRFRFRFNRRQSAEGDNPAKWEVHSVEQAVLGNHVGTYGLAE